MRRRARFLALVIVALVFTPWSVSVGTASERPATSAHRGGAAYAPENTMLAFRNAVRLGVDILEMDAQLSADGAVVIVHDDTLERTTDCSGAVDTLTLDQLRACDAAYWFSPGQPTTRVDEDAAHPLRGTGVTIPTAEEVFAYVASLGDGSPEISIEIKDIPGEANFDPAGTAVASELVPLIQASGIADRIHVQSFWPPALEAVKAMDPTIRTLFLTTPEVGATATENLAYVVARGHDISSPAWTTPDAGPEFAQAAHAAGKQFVPWTVDAREDIETVAAWGPDAIITNFPACQADVLGHPRPEDVRPPELVAAGSPPLAACPGGTAPGSPSEPTGAADPADPSEGRELPATGAGLGWAWTVAVAAAAASRVGTRPRRIGRGRNRARYASPASGDR